MDEQLTEQQLEQVYNWIDEIPLSRPKKNMARDFSDAVLFAEVIDHFNPKLIEVHNYTATGSLIQKIANWKTINRKILTKLKLSLTDDQIESIANSSSGIIQQLIYKLKKCIEKGEISSPLTISKSNKGNASLSILKGIKMTKRYHKMSLNQLKKHKDVYQLLTSKDEQIQLLKSYIQLLTLKSSKLQEMLHSKDREIQQILAVIKNSKK